MAQTKKIVLVIEDEQPLLEAIRIKLEKCDFEVVTARTVQQALNYLEDIKTVDAIWLDHYLIGGDSGLDFLVKIKNGDANLKKIPVFVVSNTATSDKVQSYLQLGIEKYYIKSDYRLDQIIEDIKKNLETVNGNVK
ncbi:MAG: response regulator [Patescibacteria group bacterium]